MGESKEGEIIFEVRFKRREVVPLEEVGKRPTATEIDDFLEYKRLRKFQRDGKRRVTEATTQSVPIELQHIARDEPLVVSPHLSGSGETAAIPSPESSGLSRRSMFKCLRYDMPERDPDIQPDVISPGTIGDVHQFPLVLSNNSTILIPAHAERQQHLQVGAESTSTGSKNLLDAGIKSITSSAHVASNRGPDIREVAPWIDYEYALTVPTPTDNAPHSHDEVNPQTSKEIGQGTKHSHPSSNTEKNQHHDAKDSSSLPTIRNRTKSGNFKGLTGLLSPGSLAARRADTRKLTPTRSSNPMAKLFDGAASTDEGDDGGSADSPYESRTTSLETLYNTPNQDRRRQRASSSDSAIRVHSPKPIRLFSSESPYGMARRGAIYTDEDEVPHVALPIVPAESITSTKSLDSPDNDPFVETSSSAIPASLPVSLEKFMLQSEAALPVDSGTSSPSHMFREDTEDSDAAERLREAVDGMDIKVAFKDPFCVSPRANREHSVSVAPDIVA
jgi:hypothetical protein